MSERGRVQIRAMQKDDIPEILALGRVCFPSIPPERHWVAGMLEAHMDVFPDGQRVAVLPGAGIVGSSTSLRLPLRDAVRPHTWRDITGGGYLTTHTDKGDALYGTEIMVHPDRRRLGIGRALYEARKDLVRTLGLKAFVTGGRIPGYARHADHMTPQQYAALVVAGEIEDRVLTPQLRSGLTFAGILPGYLTDENSGNNATLLVWRPGPKPRPAPSTLDTVGHET